MVEEQRAKTEKLLKRKGKDTKDGKEAATIKDGEKAKEIKESKKGGDNGKSEKTTSKDGNE